MIKRLFSRPRALAGLALALLIVLVAAAAPLLAPPDDPANPSPFKLVGVEQDGIPKPPSVTSPLGTAPGQLDIYYTLIWGTRSALLFGLSVAGFGAVFGSLYGAASGYAGGWIDGLAMRVADGLMAFPVLVAVWLFNAVVLGRGVQQLSSLGAEPTIFQTLLLNWRMQPLLLAMALLAWMPYARLVNAGVKVAKETEFVAAAHAIGARPVRILFLHLLPNALAPTIVLWARDVGGTVVLGTTFTFIGVGQGLEWASLLVTGRQWIFGAAGNVLAYWWAWLPFVAALVLFSLAWTLLGDGLNAALDPRSD